MSRPSTWIDDELWESIQSSVPIVCVDVVPVRRDGDGVPVQVGLIRRLGFPGRATWCHVGGRVGLDESLAESLRRHVLETLGVEVSDRLGPDPQPLYVQQYHRDPARHAASPGSGWDPRKHAVGLSYLVTFDEEVQVVPGGEGLELSWFGVGELGTVEGAWPGSLEMVRRLLELDSRLRP